MANFELKLSFIVVTALALVYIAYELLTVPKGGHPFGHALGIIGALLMLMTELLYSARKRWGLFRAGQVRHWLSFHIFTGIVGPFLVLMHTGLEFRGLAGITLGLTALVVASGFLGRYIYTAVPRTLAGVEIDRRLLEAEAMRQRDELLAWAESRSQQAQAVVRREMAATAALPEQGTMALLGWKWQEWQAQRRTRAALAALDQQERSRVREIEGLLRRQQRLVRQIHSLETARRMMGWWHAAHVPMGMTLFSAMAVHIVAVIYYGAL
jgi:hypothetical protein